MTFLEKAVEIEKEKTNGLSEYGIIEGMCPQHYGLESKNVNCIEDGEKCRACWNREMPTTEPLTEKEKMIDAMSENAYNKGLNDAWELVKKCADMDFDTICEHILEGDALHPLTAMVNCLTPQEALAKLKAYEDSKNRVQVGDVIKTPVGNAVVTYVREEEYIAITSSGAYVRLEGLVAKTGKHLDIQSILSQIGE